MYKDKDRQREAVKLATRRYRNKGITKVSQEQGITASDKVIPEYLHQPHCNAPRFVEPFTKGVSCSCRPVVVEQPKAQSYNPIMVGYVPLRKP